MASAARASRAIFALCTAFLSASLAAQTPSSVAFFQSPNSASLGQAVTLSAVVSPAGTTGKVTFYDGTTVLGIRNLSASQASMTTVLLGSGTHSLRAYYGGDGTYAPSSSTPGTPLTVTAGVSLGMKAGVNNPTGSYPYSLAIADFNNDSRQDLAVTTNSAVQIFLGNGDGTFQSSGNYATITSARIATGDLNGDGNTDILLSSGSLRILLGNGDGTFQNPVTLSSTVGIWAVLADFNGDGKLDIAAGSSSQAQVGILIGNGDGTFQAAVTYVVPSPPTSLAIGDFNGDGKADLTAVCATANSVVILRGNGDGTMQAAQSFATGASPFYVAVGDVNNDTKLDVVASSTNSPEGFYTLLGNGDGTLQASTTTLALSSYGSGAALALADFGGDGILDVIMMQSGYSPAIYAGNGDGTFQAGQSIASAVYPYSVVVGEFNGDAKTDIAYSNYYGSNFIVQLGGAAADLSLTLFHGHGLTQGQTGAYYSITVANNGSFPTVGAVGVIATLPPELTATSIAGTGWTCVLATKTCTRSDVLAIGASYPPIKITVNVAGNVSGNVSTSVVVSGGGDNNSSNNQVTDTTMIRFAVTTALTSSPQPSQLGQSVTLTATVSAGTGQVTFYDGSKILGTSSLSGTQAVLSVALSQGVHSLTARYLGDSTYGPSLSAVRSHAVNSLATNGLAAGASYAFLPGTPAPSFLVSGDFNKDGKLDLVVDGGQTLLGAGDGTFQSVTGYVVPSGNGYYGAYGVAGDFNLDGKLDLIRSTDTTKILLGNGDGTFQAAQATVPPNVVFSEAIGADMDADGKPDLVGVTNGTLAVALGNGDGTFQSPLTISSSVQLGTWSVADFNGDDRLDIAREDGGFTTLVYVYLGNGDGTFQAPTNIPSGTTYVDSLVTGDFNGDGKADIVTTAWTGASAMLGNGNGTFQSPIKTSVGTTDFRTITGDFNGDNKLDFAYLSYSPSDQVIIAFGNGDGSFQSPLAIVTTGTSRSAFLTGDFNRDGRLDLAVAGGSSNTTANTKIFLGGQFTGLGVAMNHRGKLTAGQAKDYQIVISNPAFAAAAGSVTMGITLPSGLSLTALSGSGWTCSIGSSTCNRSDTLSGSYSYPAITATIYASASLSPTTLTPFASVFWNSTSNIIPDPTAIVQATTTTLSATPNPATQGQNVTLTATVSAGTGNVSFFDGGVLLGTAALSGNTAVLTTNRISTGVRKINASYTGDSTRGPSTSTSLSLNVQAGQSSGLITAANPATGTAPSTMIAADLNLDGKLDLITTNSTGNTISVLLGNGNGTFQPRADYAVGTNPIVAASGDFNGDGKPDIAVANSSSSNVSILLNTGTGAYSAATNIPLINAPGGLLVGDFDLDGKADLAIAGGSSNASIYFGMGDGTFTPDSSSTNFCCSGKAMAGEFNCDGKTDLLIYQNMYLGNGDGTFQPATYVGYSPTDEAVGDLNNDGKLDLAVASYSYTSILLGTGNGSFTSGTSVGTYNQYGVAISDVNGDGNLDVIATNYSSNAVVVWFGVGNGTFPTSITYATGTGPRGVVTGDFNNDGRTDIAVANYSSNNVTVLLGILTPVVNVTKTHPGDFYRGQTGATYKITVSNGGPGITSGTITATDLLPNGLTMTSISGSGWTCVLGSKSCSRSDALGVGASYPPITVTVNVAANADALIVNEVDVTGGGSPTVAAFDATTVLTSLTQGLAARAVFRDSSGGIRMTNFGSSTLSNSGGVLASDPSVSEAPGGWVFVAARDSSNAVWTNVYNPGTQAWVGWQFGGGQIQGVPAIAAATNGVAWIAARDAYNSYWLTSYDGSAYGTWLPLGGVFSTDPVLAPCGDGSIYLVGKDNYNALWSAHYIPGVGLQGFVLGGGVVQGKPSLTCGNDNAAYIVVRDNWNSSWVARVAGNTWTGWFNGGAVTSIDPQIAGLGGSLGIVILDAGGAVYRNSFNEGSGNGWQSWTSVGGVLNDIAPVALGGELFFAGHSPDGGFWWWRQSGNQWTGIGNAGVGGGKLVGTPR